MNNIALSELIVELRRELVDAQRQGAEEELKFRVEDIDIEVHVKASREGNGKAGIKFWVCTAEAGGKLASETLQKIRLTLKPESSSGGDVLVSDFDEK